MHDVLWLVGFGLFVAGYIALGVRQAKATRLKRELARATERRVRSWKCRNCGAIYGDKSVLAFFGESPDRAAPHCILVCDECKYLNRFDRGGNAQYGRGEPFDDAARAAIGD